MIASRTVFSYNIQIAESGKIIVRVDSDDKSFLTPVLGGYK